MASLSQRLQSKINSLQEGIELSESVLRFMPDIITGSKQKGNYTIYVSTTAGAVKYVRPINHVIFINEPVIFRRKTYDFLAILQRIKRGERNLELKDKSLIDSVIYTIQQSFGAGMDLLIQPNSARKHVGNRFEELLRLVFTEIGVTNNNGTLKIPYGSGTKRRIYNCENDIVLSPFPNVRSTGNSLDESEVVVSIKTSSKDRMGKIFIDKMLLQRFVGHPQKVIGVFLNDVQRKESDNVSFTLVSGLFMVYTQFLTELDGVYYLDPPPNALIEPWSKHISPFSELLTVDVFRLLTP